MISMKYSAPYVERASMTQPILTLELQKKHPLAFLVGKYIIWELALTRGQIITRWLKPKKTGLSYNVAAAKSKEELQENMDLYMTFYKEIRDYSDEDLKEALIDLDQYSKKIKRETIKTENMTTLELNKIIK